MSIFAQNYRTELEIYMNQQYPSVLLEKAVGRILQTSRNRTKNRYAAGTASVTAR